MQMEALQNIRKIKHFYNINSLEIVAKQVGNYEVFRGEYSIGMIARQTTPATLNTEASSVARGDDLANVRIAFSTARTFFPS